ncbi:MAG: sodium:alanine symporter family protein [Oligoflexia bacterium]|nr:sodium:alanine symporter family protein [Oligoflexia bacterium]
MARFAEWMWNPVLCFVYIEIGIIFLWLTKGIALRRGFIVLRHSLFKAEVNPSEESVSHTKALFSTLAATIGVGNLAGVGTAIHLGGPGALFWMWVSAFFGVSFRMISTYLAIKCQPTDTTSPSFATPMSYLTQKIRWFGGKISWMVASLILIQCLITANLIQSNSVAHAMKGKVLFSDFVVAALLTMLVGLVILGGLQKIVRFSSILAPLMHITYVLIGAYILISDPLTTIKALGSVFYYAFTPYSFFGGVAGYTVLQALQFGVARGVFSHGSGTGVCPFFQGANRDHPSVGALMSAVTPVIDTFMVCTITGLVVLSGTYWPSENGAYLTAVTYASKLGEVGHMFIVVCLMVFAFTTIITNANYAERCFLYLGGNNIKSFRLLFLFITFIGPFFPVIFVWSLGDVLVGLLVVVHLIPMTYIALKNFKIIRDDLLV